MCLPRAGGGGTVFSRAAPKARDRQPPHGTRATPAVPVQPLSPAPEAALPLCGLRVLRDTSAARRAPPQAASRTPDAPSRLPPAHGMDPTTPASAGAGLLPASAGAMTGPLQRRGRARDLPRAAPLCSWGDRRDVHRAQAAGRQAAPLHVGAVDPRPRPRQESASSSYSGSTSESVCRKAGLGTAAARPTEEPEAGKLHVRVCTGGPGHRHAYRRDASSWAIIVRIKNTYWRKDGWATCSR